MKRDTILALLVAALTALSIGCGDVQKFLTGLIPPKKEETKPSVPVVTEFPRAIIVLGGGNEKENPAWEMFNGLANYVYKSLKSRNFSDNDIYYLSPSLKVVERVDGITSESSLEFAITQLTKQRVGRSPLFIYLLSHNLDDKFILEKRGNLDVILTPEKLNVWLDLLPKETEVTLIIESSFSGTFISRKVEGKPVLSKPGRVIITSASHDKQGIILRSGLLSFTRLFFDNILQNRDIKTAFLEARNSLKAYNPRSLQNPKIDANGDGVSNDPILDYSAVENKYIPFDLEQL